MNNIRATTATLRAHMPEADEPNPGNPIHSTASAQDYGFRGALVGGVTVYGWAVRTLVAALGIGWLSSGHVHLRFRRPVYPNDSLDVRVDEQGAFQIARGQETCVEGQAGLGIAPWFSGLSSPALSDPIPVLDKPPRLAPLNVPVGEALRSLGAPLSSAEALRYHRDKLFEQDINFVGENPLIHPAWLAEQPIRLLHHSFDYGPAIHAESHIQHLMCLRTPAELVISGQCVQAFERKGHHYMVNDCCIGTANGLEVARLRHTVIYQVAKPSAKPI